jgi:hypothetical protein
MLADNKEWSIAEVYGPLSDNEKNPIHAGNHEPETIHAPSMAIARGFQLDLSCAKQEQWPAKLDAAKWVQNYNR